DTEYLILVVPSHVMRKVVSQLKDHIYNETIIISASKGIENNTLLRMSEVIIEILPSPLHQNIAVISGPSFAKEVSKRLPTAVVVAANNISVAQKVQNLFSCNFLRTYTNNDICGVELGGAIKNIIAIATGITDGLCLGCNTRASLITRGLAEMTKLGVTLGACEKTFYGLSGMGDLVLTTTSELSRNYTLGFRVGQGEKLQDVLNSTKMVAEGVKTAKAVKDLANKHEVEMPITFEVNNVLFNEKSPQKAVNDLMKRKLKSEY
ncbi:MAG: NAD(P)H-dependent glycerol-3-phosphate dehydrogenase, partial [bacterium]